MKAFLFSMLTLTVSFSAYAAFSPQKGTMPAMTSDTAKPSETCSLRSAKPPVQGPQYAFLMPTESAHRASGPSQKARGADSNHRN